MRSVSRLRGPVLCLLVLAALPLLSAGADEPRPIVIEGEALAGAARATQGRVIAFDMRRFGSGWSGNQHLSWVPPTAGHQLHLRLRVPNAGLYDLALYYTRANNHADFNVYVARKQVGATQRGYSSAVVNSGRVVLGRVTLARGLTALTVTGTGKDRRSRGFVVGIDKFELTPVRSKPPPPAVEDKVRESSPGAIVIEGESLAGTARATRGRVIAFDMRRFGNHWSGNQHLSWVPPTAGHQLQIRLRVARAGVYDLAIYYTRANNHADFNVYVGRKQVGPTQRGYSAGVVNSGRIALGRVTLLKGLNPAAITGIGKDRRSRGFVVGVDKFELTPVRPPAPTVDDKIDGKGRTDFTFLKLPKELLGPGRDYARLPRQWILPGGGFARIHKRPELAVLLQGTGEHEHWRQELLIDPERNEPLDRKFRWVNRRADVAKVVWQISTFEPAPIAAGWESPPALRAHGELTAIPALDKDAEFFIDFAKFHVGAVALTPKGAPKSGSRMTGDSLTATSRQFPSSDPQRPTIFVPAKPSFRPSYGSTERTYYVRLVPLDSAGRVAGLPSNAVLVRIGRGPPQHLDLSHLHYTPDPPAWIAKVRPRVRILQWAPIRWPDEPEIHWITTREWLGYPAGYTFTWDPSVVEEKSFWEKVEDAVGSIFDYFADAVNWVSTAFETLKEEAVNFAANHIPGCGKDCRDLLKDGLEIGLMSLGIPPELPNFDELVEMGKGNLVDMLVAEAENAGIPDKITREAAERFIDEIERSTREKRTGGPTGQAWMVPDPAYQFRPAFVRFAVTNPGPAAIEPVVHISAATAPPDGKGWTAVLHGRSLALPPLAAGERKVVTVFLRRNLSEWEERDRLMHDGHMSRDRAHDDWWAGYHGPCNIHVDVQAIIQDPDGKDSVRMGFSGDGLHQPANKSFFLRHAGRIPR